MRLLKRSFKYWWQRRTRGWDDSDLWSLDYTILRFTLPRLKRFRNYTHRHPCEFESEKEWEEVIDKMIRAIEIVLDEDCYPFWTDNEDAKEGMELFFKYFFHLWS